MPSSVRTLARPAVGISTPSLTRHIVIFLPERTLENTSERDSKKALIIKYVESLLCFADASGALNDTKDNTMSLFTSSFEHYASFCITLGTFIGLPLRIIISSYNEHLTLTFILDSDQASLPSHCDAELFSSYVHEHLLTESYIPAGLDIASSHGKTTLLYEVFWDALNSKLDNYAFITPFKKQIFGDMRGLILSADIADGELKDDDVFSEIQLSKPAATAGRKPDIREPLAKRADFFSDVLDKFSSKHLYGGEQPSARWDPNNVLCYIGGKAAIYGSALFLLNPKDPTTFKDESYLRHFIIFDDTNIYSIGRLLRRLHVLFELRTMAFIERHEISSTYDALLKIGRKLSDMIDSMTNESTLDIAKFSRIIETYNDIGRGKNSIDELVIEENVCDEVIRYKRCSGGLLYRVNRSRYYYNSLRSRMHDLRSQRIKGFQPYKRFVHRNYDQMMEAIISISERYTQLGQRIERAISLTHTLQQRKITQYALVATVIFSGFSALSALGGASNLYGLGCEKTRFYKSGVIGLFVIFSLSVLFVLYWLRERNLYVNVVRKSWAGIFMFILLYVCLFWPFLQQNLSGLFVFDCP